MVSSSVTDAQQGTQIILDAKRGDFQNFNTWVQKTAQYWEVRPNIVGCDNFSWKDKQTILSGNGWTLEPLENSYYNYEDNHMKALVDGIPYTVNGENVDISSSNKSCSSLRKLLESPVRVRFNIGELQLTANRENLENTDKNKKVLLKAMEEIVKDVEKITQDEISKCSNLWDALSKWKIFRKSNLGSFVEKTTYKGIEISDASTTFAMPRDQVDYFLCTRKSGYEPKINKGGYLFFTDKTRLYIDDTDAVKPSRARIATLFNNNPNLTEVQVIKFLTTDKKELDELNKKFYIDQLSTGVLSVVEKMKNINRSRTGVGSRGPIAKAKIFDGDVWESVDDIDFEEDEGIYVALSYNKPVDALTKREYNASTLYDISKCYDIQIYGIPLRYVEKLGDGWVTFGEWAKKKYDKLKNDPEVKEYKDEYERCREATFESSYGLKVFLTRESFLDRICNQDSIIHKYVQRSKLILSVRDKIANLRTISYVVGEDILDDCSSKTKYDFEIYSLKTKFEESYPLLVAAFFNSYGNSRVTEEDVLFYINAIEEKNQKEVAKAEE